MPPGKGPWQPKRLLYIGVCQADDRLERYNALNHPQFANPGTSLNTAAFGVITQNSVAPRLIQFALKYLF